MDIRPLTSLSIKAFNIKGGAQAIVTPNCKEASIHQCDAKVTAGFQQGGHIMPGVSLRVIGLSRAETSGSIEATNLHKKRENRKTGWLVCLWFVILYFYKEYLAS